MQYKIDTTFLDRCISALDKAYIMLDKYTTEDIEYDIYRSAIIKEFEIILEQSGKLLKKAIKPYFATSQAVDKLYFKDIFREAGLHGLLTIEEIERWCEYRDSRNYTSHEYGESLANNILELITQFVKDATKLSDVVGK